jgi:hypothetical protein
MAMELPEESRMALKEWASVLEALGRGEQLLLIRKGGLIEPGSGFELVTRSFVFYPTFEHQTVNFLRPEHRGAFDAAMARRAPAGQVRFELAGLAINSMETNDPGIVERLRPFHVYNEDFLKQRLKWQPDMPLVLAIIRAYRLAAPAVVAADPAYAGCKSWVELSQPVGLRGATPVVPEAEFEQEQVLHLLLGGQDDDRDGGEGGVGAQLLDERVAVHPRHHDVGDDDVRLVRQRLFEPFQPVGRGDDVVVLRGQPPRQDLEH